MSKRRLALVFATSGHSGVDRVVKNLLPEFGKTDHHFDLLLIRNHGPHLEVVPDNVKVRRLAAGSKNTVLPSLAWYLWRYRPAALLTANHKLNRAALMARALTRVSTRVIIRMGTSVAAQRDEMKATRAEALSSSMRKWYPRADAVVTPSQGVGKDLIEIAGVSPGRLSVIPNPIVNEHFYKLAAEPVSHPWFRESSCPVILGVGSLEPRKDFSTLLKAFARVRQQTRCRLVILGEGKERGQLLELAQRLGVQNDVDLPGYEHNPYRFMSRAAVFVLASRREGASAVVVEALACGTSVVSTDCPSGPAEALQDGRFGVLVPMGDEAAMASGILQSMNSPLEKDFLKAATERNRVDVSAQAYLRLLEGP